MRVPSSSSSNSVNSLLERVLNLRTLRVYENLPTVIGLILTPSSRCAFVASSASLPWRTFFPQRVLTNVVRPGRQAVSVFHLERNQVELSIPVPEAPQTMRQNWI